MQSAHVHVLGNGIFKSLLVVYIKLVLCNPTFLSSQTLPDNVATRTSQLALQWRKHWHHTNDPHAFLFHLGCPHRARLETKLSHELFKTILLAMHTTCTVNHTF